MVNAGRSSQPQQYSRKTSTLRNALLKDHFSMDHHSLEQPPLVVQFEGSQHQHLPIRGGGGGGTVAAAAASSSSSSSATSHKKKNKKNLLNLVKQHKQDDRFDADLLQMISKSSRSGKSSASKRRNSSNSHKSSFQSHEVKEFIQLSAVSLVIAELLEVVSFFVNNFLFLNHKKLLGLDFLSIFERVSSERNNDLQEFYRNFSQRQVQRFLKFEQAVEDCYKTVLLTLDSISHKCETFVDSLQRRARNLVQNIQTIHWRSLPSTILTTMSQDWSVEYQFLLGAVCGMAVSPIMVQHGYKLGLALYGLSEVTGLVTSIQLPATLHKLFEQGTTQTEYLTKISQSLWHLKCFGRDILQQALTILTSLQATSETDPEGLTEDQVVEHTLTQLAQNTIETWRHELQTSLHQAHVQQTQPPPKLFWGLVDLRAGESVQRKTLLEILTKGFLVGSLGPLVLQCLPAAMMLQVDDDSQQLLSLVPQQQ